VDRWIDVAVPCVEVTTYYVATQGVGHGLSGTAPSAVTAEACALLSPTLTIQTIESTRRSDTDP
jgi:hypothetical protein